MVAAYRYECLVFFALLVIIVKLNYTFRMAPMNPNDASNVRSEVFDHEVLFLFFQAAASTGSPLPGPYGQEAWPPVE